MSPPMKWTLKLTATRPGVVHWGTVFAWVDADFDKNSFAADAGRLWAGVDFSHWMRSLVLNGRAKSALRWLPRLQKR